METDPFRILGVEPGTDLPSARRAYLAKVREAHPDRLIDADPATVRAAEERMRQINEAWRVLQEGPPPAPAPDAPTWRPPADDEPDEPIDLLDEGRPPNALARRVTSAGPLLFVSGIGTGFFGAVVGSVPVLAIGFVMFILAVACFLMAPLLVMAGARRDG